jgi:hypothetical protein
MSLVSAPTPDAQALIATMRAALETARACIVKGTPLQRANALRDIEAAIKAAEAKS